MSGSAQSLSQARRRLRTLARHSRARLRALAWSWRRSLRIRVAVTTVAVGLAAVALLGAVLTGQVRDSLFEDRLQEVLADAATRAEAAQRLFDNSSASSPAEVQQLAYDVYEYLGAAGGGSAEVALIPSPDTDRTVPILGSATDRRLLARITPALRQQVQTEQRQLWQSIAVPTDGGGAPGIVVGTLVTLPGAGVVELYLVYSLAPEQATLDLVQRVLVLGAVSLVLLLLVMTWYLTRQVLSPVQHAARTAGRLADGLLTERMEVRGEDELALLGRSFNEMAQSMQNQIERLAELSRMQQRFVSDVSHELRTPLTTIRMASEVLHDARDRLGPTEARSAELLAAQLDRFESLLADLLEISRFDAGAAVLEAEEADLREVVGRVVDLTQPLAQPRGTELVVRLPSSPARADMDVRRVERVLRNLLVNAIEHGEGAPIEILVGSDARAVSAVVRDHGVGMTAREAEHVFDRFWRADTSRVRTLGGTGLGLAISLEDARLHGGTLEAWGSPGEGASFRLTLPRRARQPVTSHPLALRPARRSDPPPPHRDPSGPQALPTDLMAEVHE